MLIKMVKTSKRVKDLEKSIKFYEESLGIVKTEIKDFPEYKFTLDTYQMEEQWA